MPAVVNNITQWNVQCDSVWRRKKQAVVSQDAAQWLSNEDSKTDIEPLTEQMNEQIREWTT